MTTKVRINRYLARAGFGSRRRCEELVRRGSVSVNGTCIDSLSVTIDPERDTVAVDGKTIVEFEKTVILAMNKPPGVISSVTDPFKRKTVIDIAHEHGYTERLFPVGRLDFDTTGILLLTNDGEVANRLMHPRHGIEKTYRVVVEGKVSRGTVSRIAGGIKTADFTSQPCRVKIVKQSGRNTELEVTLKEGKKRQVKRMFEIVHHPVIELHRAAIGGITFKDIPAGCVRPLHRDEEKKLRELIDLS
jgi:pseudouridine synthase